jgi:anti-sigma B factor antagonist
VAPVQGKSEHVRTGEIAFERSNEGLAVLTVRGEHDLSTAPDLRRRLKALIGEGDAIVVDLSPATFVDSTILGVILDACRRASDAGLGFAVAAANGGSAVDRVLEVTGLKAELPVHSARKDAALAAAGPAGRAT